MSADAPEWHPPSFLVSNTEPAETFTPVTGPDDGDDHEPASSVNNQTKGNADDTSDATAAAATTITTSPAQSMQGEAQRDTPDLAAETAVAVGEPPNELSAAGSNGDHSRDDSARALPSAEREETGEMGGVEQTPEAVSTGDDPAASAAATQPELAHVTTSSEELQTPAEDEKIDKLETDTIQAATPQEETSSGGTGSTIVEADDDLHGEISADDAATGEAGGSDDNALPTEVVFKKAEDGARIRDPAPTPTKPVTDEGQDMMTTTSPAEAAPTADVAEADESPEPSNVRAAGGGIDISSGIDLKKGRADGDENDGTDESTDTSEPNADSGSETELSSSKNDLALFLHGRRGDFMAKPSWQLGAMALAAVAIVVVNLARGRRVV